MNVTLVIDSPTMYLNIIINLIKKWYAMVTLNNVTFVKNCKTKFFNLRIYFLNPGDQRSSATE
jgi:hypothetical protein